MSDIFREVDEDVRRDQALEFWKKYQNYIVAAVVLVLLATAGWRVYEWRRTAAAEAAGAKFEDAIELDRAGKTAEASAAFAKLATDAPAGYVALARLADAATLSKTDPARAIEAYDGLAADGSLNALFRDAARFRGAILRLDNGQADKAQATLEQLADPSGAFRNSAREILAAIALAAGDFDKANHWLELILADPEAPQSARQNAGQMAAMVRSDKPAAK
jgi:hypothetical protein